MELREVRTTTLRVGAASILERERGNFLTEGVRKGKVKM